MPAKRESDWATRPLEDELGEALRAELLSWSGVAARPVMGCLAFFRGKRMLGCYANRAISQKKPEWLNRPGEPTFVCVRLREADAARALRRRGVRASRFEFMNWIEVSLDSRAMLEEAVRCFGTAYEHLPRETSQKRPPKR
jgi:hypothetical protein